MITFIADPHIDNHKRHGGNYKSSLNERCTLSLNVLERSVQRSLALGSSRLYVLGDLFDNVKPIPQVIGRVQNILEKIPTVILLGNHEQVSESPGDNALVCMENTCTVVETTQVIEEEDRYMLCVPFKPGDARMWLEGELEIAKDYTDKPVTVCLHLGIQDDESPFFLKGCHDSIEASTLFDLMEMYGVESAITGNWHNRKVWTRGNKTIFQTGALIPTGFDNPGSEGYGTLGILNNSDITFEEISGPRFLKISADEFDVKKIFKYPGSLYLEVSGAGDRLVEISEQLRTLKLSGCVRGYSIVRDLTSAKKTASTAVKMIACSRSINEGVANYIRTMDIPPTTTDKEVFAAVLNYLSQV